MNHDKKKNGEKIKIKTIYTKDSITMEDSITTIVSSNYLLYSNRERCAELLKQTRALEEKEITDLYVSLHFVLEIGLNTLYRKLFSSLGSMSSYDNEQFSKNVDEVGFIDKTRMFLSISKFTFKDRDEVEKSKKYQKYLIRGLIDFVQPRNKLVHGHSISSISSEGYTKDSSAKKILSAEKLKNQLDRFREIIDMVIFFLDRTESEISESQIETFKKSYLDTTFLGNQ